LQCEARFPNTGRADQGDELNIPTRDQLGELALFTLAADERGQRARERWRSSFGRRS
jgi:hypothetical protein